MFSCAPLISMTLYCRPGDCSRFGGEGKILLQSRKSLDKWSFYQSTKSGECELMFFFSFYCTSYFVACLISSYISFSKLVKTVCEGTRSCMHACIKSSGNMNLVILPTHAHNMYKSCTIVFRNTIFQCLV